MRGRTAKQVIYAATAINPYSNSTQFEYNERHLEVDPEKKQKKRSLSEKKESSRIGMTFLWAFSSNYLSTFLHALYTDNFYDPTSILCSNIEMMMMMMKTISC